MLLLTAFNTLLYRLTHQEDFLVGVPITGRDQIETEGLIGFFSNTIVMPNRLSSSLSFRQFLQQTRATVPTCTITRTCLLKNWWKRFRPKEVSDARR